MIYIVDEEKKFTSADDAAEYITENMNYDAFDEMLNETSEEVNVRGYTFSPSDVLKELDETAYSCEKNDYYDSLSRNISYEIDRIDDRCSKSFYGFDVGAVDDEWYESEIEDLEEELGELDSDNDNDRIDEIEKELQELRKEYEELMAGVVA
jgi:type I restriction-modification system DNA methylase subunit